MSVRLFLVPEHVKTVPHQGGSSAPPLDAFGSGVVSTIARRSARSTYCSTNALPRRDRSSRLQLRVQIHIGCSGWFYWHWRGIFYPDTKRTDTWFKHYVANFDTVELNAPFYSWPKDATVRSWRRNAPENFRYSAKVNRPITHEKRLRRTGILVRKFCGLESILGDKLGCFLFQFPPSYKYTPSRLKSIVHQLDPSFRHAVEFRHKSWWRTAVYRAFEKRDLTFCSVSSPRLPPALIRTND